MTTTDTAYEFRVRGHLDDRWASWFGEVTLTRNDDGTTTVVGPVIDQAQLHGMLASIRDVGATLLSVHAADGATGRERSGSEDGVPTGPPVLDRALRTGRLTLRPATEQDAEATWRFRRLEPVGEWLTGTPADLDAYRTLFNDPARLATTIIIELDQPHQREGTDGAGSPHVIGDLMLKREDAWAQTEVADLARGAQVELGWVLDPANTGHGYATEAVQELLRYAFEDLGVRRVVANCFLDNESSWRLMERVGMRRETHAVRESLHRSGRWLDTLTYAVLADEWRGLH
jgi:RimJ/RimL family protein N-acetyltransferase